MEAGEGHDHKEGDRFQEKIVAAKNPDYLENHNKRSRRLRGEMYKGETSSRYEVTFTTLI